MSFKKTKWFDYKFSADELEARKLWKSADKRRGELLEALKTCQWFETRKEYHTRLDYLLDRIEKTEKHARKLFPKVSESNDIFEMTLKL